MLFSFRRSFVPVEIWHQSKLPAEWLIYWSSFNKHYRHLPLLQPGHHCSLNNRLLYSLFSRLSFTAQWWTCWLLLFIWRFVSGQCVLCVHHPVFWQCIHNVLLHAYNSEQLHFFICEVEREKERLDIVCAYHNHSLYCPLSKRGQKAEEKVEFVIFRL